MAPEGQPPTETQKRLFGETPGPGSDLRLAAKTVAIRLSRIAYRRPASEAEIELLLRVFDLGQDSKLDLSGVSAFDAQGCTRFSSVPIHHACQGARFGADHCTAGRLSTRISPFVFDLATTPDTELSSLADAGQVHEQSVLKSQVKRMLADPRSRALFDGFGAQWLGVRDLESKAFDIEMFRR